MSSVIIRVVLSCVFLLVVGCKTVSSKSAKAVVLTHVNIVDTLNRTIIPNQQVWMSGGLIQSIRPANQQLDLSDVNEINGHGGFVTPGLIDMHTHIYDKAAVAISLSHGVVHMRVLNGMPQLLKWREKLKAGDLWGSTISVSSPIITGNPNDTLRTYVETTVDARHTVVESSKKGYDLIKVYNNLSPELQNAAISQAKELNIPVAKHGPHPPAGMPWEGLKGLQSLEHVEDIFQGPLAFKQDAEKLEGVLAKLKSLNVPIVPTLAIFEQLTRISSEKEAFLEILPENYTPPIIRYVEKKGQIKRWLDSSAKRAEFNRNELEYLIEITREIHDRGIPILVGSDSGVLMLPSGIGTHREMALLVKAGLSNFDVIRAATINPATALGLSSELGQIKPGARADFIYTQDNPVENLSVLENPDAVIKVGVWHSTGSLKEHREKAIGERSFFKELWLLLSNY